MKYLKIFTIIFLYFFTTNVNGQCPAGPGGGCDGSGTSLDLYWVGTNAANDGNWNSPCSWRVGSTAGVEPCQAPRSVDNVFFVPGSFTGVANPVLTINTQARCNNFFVDPAINFLAVIPEYRLENPGFLEIYGNFTLQNQITWNVVGGNTSGPEVLFKATTVGNTIETNGIEMQAIQFDGNGGEWALQDDLRVGSINFVLGYLTTSDGTNSHDINALTFDSDVQPGGSSANRRLDLNSSIFTLRGSSGSDRYPYNTTNAPKTVWECRATGAPQFNFNAGTSKIIFTTTSPFLRLGGLTYNVIDHTGTGRFYDHFGPNTCVIDTMITNGRLYFHHQHTFNVLQINSVSQEHNFFQHQTINTDLIVSGNVCVPTIFKSEYNRLLTMPAAVTADPMNGFTIDNLRCSDGTAGHNLGGNGLGTTTGWNITAPAARDLYWVGGTNNNWSEPTNWATAPAGVPLLGALDCPPLQTDNVFFIPSLANGATVTLNQTATCNNQTWTITAAATFNGGSTMNIYGNLQLDSDINFACSSAFNFFGTAGNTILSAGITLPSTSYIKQFADYTLLDDLNFNGLYLFRQTGFNSGGFDMTGNILYFRGGTQDFSGSTITLAGGTPWYSAGNQGSTTYDASSHVLFTNTGATTLISGWGQNLKFPEFTLQSNATTLRIRDHFGHSAYNNIVFEGNVNLQGSIRYYADYSAGVPDENLNYFTIGGDLNLNAGELYEFGVYNTITVAGNLNAFGACSSPVNIQGISGNSFTINVTGTTNLDYCNISDMQSVGAITATNSLDAGNNTNITFPVGVGTTYYWRALAGSCPGCNFDGDWASTAGYWTTVQANTEGVAGCIPQSSDNVVFDNMSFSGGQSTITISTIVSCHDITVTASNAKITGAGNLKVTGSIISDGTLAGNTFTGDLDFLSNDAAGETIDFGGVTLGADINIGNPLGTWTLQNNDFTTTKDINFNSGTFNTNGETLEMRRFNSNNSNSRTLDFGSSTINLNGTGTFATTNSPTNIYTWNTASVTNLTFNAGTSIINFTSTSEPTIKSAALNLHHVNFTSGLSALSSSPVLLVDNWATEYMKFDCSARIYGDNAYDTLEFTESNVYKIEGGSTQTLNAPDGILIATGSAGNEIAIKSITTGQSSTFHKLNTGGSMSSFCFDYISVEDNQATSDDAVFVFFTGINSNDISSSGIWDFTRALFNTPSIEADPDVSVCPGNLANINWNINGSGPYTITYTIGGGAPTSVTLPNGTPSYSINNVSHYADTDYNVTIFTGDNCGVNTTGTIIDNIQTYDVPDPNPIAQTGDNGTCNLNNENAYINIHDSGSERPLVSVKDLAGGTGLGNVVVDVTIDGAVQTHTMGSVTLNMPYLQRHFGINPDNAQPSTIRLYFSQAELDALSTAYGSVLTTADLVVTKFDNDVMDFSGANTLLVPSSSGNIPGGITTSANILYVEVSVTTFSHFLIHPGGSGALPIEFVSFDALPKGNDVELTWEVATQINNDYFTIEKSKDGKNWMDLAEIKGAGNTSETMYYTSYDYTPNLPTTFYRLKQTDFDGAYSYSKTRIVTFENFAENTVLVYPNPTKDFINIKAVDEELTSLKIYNSLGQDVTLSTTISKQTGKATVDLSRLASGLYTIKTLTSINKIYKK